MEATTKQQEALTTKGLFSREDTRKKFEEILGKRAPQFITSVLQIAASTHLQGADPMSIYNAAAMAATLDLPLNSSLGFAYIVPYNEKQKDGSYKKVAQFQIGTKGYKQLALRTGQFTAITASDVREGELKNYDRLTGKMTFEWMQDEAERLKKKIVGYVSYFELVNGYSQSFYMSVEKIQQHGNRYSKSFDNQYGLWKTDFDAMCLKTVMKQNLSKNAPLSIEMRTAVHVDQSVIKNAETEDVDYVDANEKEKPNPLLETSEEKIEVKPPHTDAMDADAGKVNPDVQDKEKGGKKGKDGKLF